MIVMHALVLLLAMACFASFVWAVSGHFRRDGRMPVGMRLTSIASLLGFLWWLYANLMDVVHPARPASAGLAAGGLLLVLSFTLFWWSVRVTRRRPLTLAFTADAPIFLHSSGPYAYIRHPFYLSYVLFWIATAVAAERLQFWLVPLLMVAIYIEAARQEERKFAHSALAGTYGAYRGQTGMLLPRLWR